MCPRADIRPRIAQKISYGDHRRDEAKDLHRAIGGWELSLDRKTQFRGPTT